MPCGHTEVLGSMPEAAQCCKRIVKFRSRNGWNMHLPLPKKTHVHVGDLVGINRLTADLTLQLTDLAEALHNNIASTPGIVGTPIQQRTSGIARLCRCCSRICLPGNRVSSLTMWRRKVRSVCLPQSF
jgi:hypothetical protein